MSLEIRITPESASRRYEPEFFRVFASNLAKLFEVRGLSGVLLGFPLTDKDKNLKPDAMIITKNVLLLVDFKNYDNRIVSLPTAGTFKSAPWTTRAVETRTKSSELVNVLGGSSLNPFAQLQTQVGRLKRIFPEEFRDIPVQTSVLFQGEVSVDGEIPGVYQRHFSIASKSNYMSVFEDSLSLTSGSRDLPVVQISSIFNTKPYTDVIPIDIDAQTRLSELHSLWEKECLAKSHLEAELLQSRIENDVQKERTGAQSEEQTSKIGRLEAQFEEVQTQYDKALAEFQLEKDNEQLRVNAAIELARHESAKAKAENSRAKQERQTVEAQIELERAKIINKAIGVNSGFKWAMWVIGLAIVLLGFAFLPLGGPSEDKTCVTSNFASEHLDKNVCIEFIPKDVRENNGHTYLNTTFDGFYVFVGDPQMLFPGEDLEQLFEGKTIRVTGIVEERKASDGSPRYSVSVDSKSQIQIVE